MLVDDSVALIYLHGLISLFTAGCNRRRRAGEEEDMLQEGCGGGFSVQIQQHPLEMGACNVGRLVIVDRPLSLNVQVVLRV